MSEEPILKYCLSEEARKAGVQLGCPRPMDAGFDLPALHDVTILPGGFALIPTGVHFAIPENWVGLVRDRSSVALKGGAATAGVIDAAYRGEVRISMHNLSGEPLSFKRSDRIAQLVVVPHLAGERSSEVSSLTELGSSERGPGGFGSTGR